MKLLSTDVDTLNMIGAITALTIMTLTILVFVFRLARQLTAESVTGIIYVLAIVPLLYLLIQAAQVDRPAIYYLQIILMIAFILVEFLLDYVFKLEFRQTQWIVVSYVTLFFASTGGMIGIASLAGRAWSLSAIILFLTMAGLAFYQRAKTGM